MIAVNKPGRDRALAAVEKGMGKYRSLHPRARIEVKRQNPASVRIRIVDPEFKGLGRVQREDLVWPFVQRLPGYARDEINVLLLLTPGEKKNSLLSVEFDELSKSAV